MSRLVQGWNSSLYPLTLIMSIRGYPEGVVLSLCTAADKDHAGQGHQRARPVDISNRWVGGLNLLAQECLGRSVFCIRPCSGKVLGVDVDFQGFETF
mmetsp:Transcript_37579/g.100016  ORF Transcript_37579/g.100016 Transcript_37579/m.100016 type:complete len:97 (-) Transcript_37579:3-293(-)